MIENAVSPGFLWTLKLADGVEHTATSGICFFIFVVVSVTQDPVAKYLEFPGFRANSTLNNLTVGFLSPIPSISKLSGTANVGVRRFKIGVGLAAFGTKGLNPCRFVFLVSSTVVGEVNYGAKKYGYRIPPLQHLKLRGAEIATPIRTGAASAVVSHDVAARD